MRTNNRTNHDHEGTGTGSSAGLNAQNRRNITPDHHNNVEGTDSLSGLDFRLWLRARFSTLFRSSMVFPCHVRGSDVR